MEDYIEAIFRILEQKRAARAKDVAERMQVTRASVSRALQALARQGFVNHEPYDIVTLTEAGRDAAEEVVRRHEALHDFFVHVLCADEGEAEAAACAMEHALSDDMVSRLSAFVKHLKQRPRAVREWRKRCGRAG
jgi:DtxR family Mn-dependent transcriptional regulator